MDIYSEIFSKLDLSGVTDADIKSYFDDLGVSYTGDSGLTTDQTLALNNAKNTSIANGNTKLTNTLDLILKYGQAALTILAKTGVIKDQNANTSTIDVSSLLGTSATNTTATTATDATNNAPSASNRVFNIDFTDPKVLIILFLVLAVVSYFLFFNKKSNGTKR